MTPTLTGRIQTRIFLVLTVGVVWTLIVTPLLPRPGGMTLAAGYRMTLQSLALMTVLGLGWELLYHLVQQVRWDKDWPSLVMLLTVVNEAALLWYVAHRMNVIPGSTALSSPLVAPFVIHLGTTWLLMWLFLQGPLRVLHLRWRFEGGRVLNLAPGHRRRRPYPGSGEPAPVGTPASGDLPAATAMSAELVEGVTCPRGHFGHPGAGNCLVCGAALTDPPVALGERPPVGILILPDGTTQVLDTGLRVLDRDGSLRFTSHEPGPDEQPVGEITLRGWQPVVVGRVDGVAADLPGGGTVRVARGVPVPLMPGTEFVLHGHRIRYDSPYQPPAVPRIRPAHLASPARAVPVPTTMPDPGPRRAALTLVAATVIGALAGMLMLGFGPVDHRPLTAARPSRTVPRTGPGSPATTSPAGPSRPTGQPSPIPSPRTPPPIWPETGHTPRGGHSTTSSSRPPAPSPSASSPSPSPTASSSPPRGVCMQNPPICLPL